VFFGYDGLVVCHPNPFEPSKEMRQIQSSRLWMLAALASGWVLVGGFSARAQLASNASVGAGLEQVMADEWSTQSSLGFVTAVQFADDSIWTGAVGANDPGTGEPIASDMLFGFASITKTYTAAVVMKLVEEGVLTLDDRIGDWIDAITFVNANITIRQLLNHTSGVYNYTNNGDLIPAVWADPDHYWTPREILTTFLKAPAFFAGTGAAYSNSNYHLAHLVIEAATGESFADVLHDRILDPLGLQRTFLPPRDTLSGTLGTTWVDINGNGELQDYRNLLDSPASHTQKGAAGGVIAEAADIARWSRHLFNANLLSVSTVDAMRSWVNLTGQNATWTGYGLGVMRYAFGDLEVWGHSGLIHGSRSMMVYSPDLDLSVAVVDNNAALNIYQLMGRILGVLSGIAAVNVEPDSQPVPSAGKAFPNPSGAMQALTIRWAPSHAGMANLEVYDVRGRLVARDDRLVNALQDDWRMDSSALPSGSGVYFYRLILPGGTPVTGSFIQQR